MSDLFEELAAVDPVAAKKEVQTIGQNANDRLLEMVLQGGKIDVLERFIALREKEELRQARLAFDMHFSAMQNEFVPAKKDKKAYDSWYAPIESLQRQYNQIITKHGFSYSWKEEAMPDNVKRIIIMISGWGFTKECYFDCPILPGTKQMNPVQVEGARSTYGKRYTFQSGFGITTEEEDTDAMGFDDAVQYSDMIKKLQCCETAQDLVDAWKEIWAELSTDKINGQDGKTKLTVIYNKCKEKFRVKKDGTTN